MVQVASEPFGGTDLKPRTVTEHISRISRRISANTNPDRRLLFVFVEEKSFMESTSSNQNTICSDKHPHRSGCL